MLPGFLFLLKWVTLTERTYIPYAIAVKKKRQCSECFITLRISSSLTTTFAPQRDARSKTIFLENHRQAGNI